MPLLDFGLGTGMSLDFGGALEVDSCNLCMKMTCLVEDRGRVLTA